MQPFLKIASAVALVCCATAPLAATTVADLSTRPITLVSPFPPGGGTDTLTRMVASGLAEAGKWNVVVENIPGAGGNLALDSTSRAQPDGHTLVMAQTDNIVLNPWLYKKLTYDTFKDFKPVGLVASSPSVFVVIPESPFKTIDDVARAASAKPGALTLGIPGVGGSGDLLGHQWRRAAKIELTHIPYRGWAQALPDLVSGRIDLYTGSVASLLPQIQAGKVRALAVVAGERSPALPDVPTFAESGFKHINQPIWWGLMAPAKTPDETIATLNGTLNKVLADESLIKRLEAGGYSVLKGTPADLAARHKADHDTFGAVVRDAGIEPQ